MTTPTVAGSLRQAACQSRAEPNPARMWNYWLGGKDNFAADREAAERVLQVMPSMPLIARAALSSLRPSSAPGQAVAPLPFRISEILFPNEPGASPR
jgi:hypothetical protein